MRKEKCAIRLKRALNIRNMKQSELSEKTKIPKSAISQYVSGAFEPRQDRIYLISNALNIDEAWLMGFDVPMERQSELMITKEAPTEKLSVSEFNEFSIFIGQMGYYITLDEDGYSIADNNSKKRKRISIDELKTLVRTSNNVVKSLIDSLMSDLWPLYNFLLWNIIIQRSWFICQSNVPL